MPQTARSKMLMAAFSRRSGETRNQLRHRQTSGHQNHQQRETQRVCAAEGEETWGSKGLGGKELGNNSWKKNWGKELEKLNWKRTWK